MPYVENLPPCTLALVDDLHIWRYLSFPALVSILQRRGLFFSKLAELAKLDPYEGGLSKPCLSELTVRYRPEHDQNRYTDGESFARAMEAKGQWTRAVSCWHISEVESAAMWRLYSGKRGIAIRSTLGQLKAGFAPDDRPIYISPVEYLDFSEVGEPRIPFYGGYAKRKNFAYEQELRASVFVPEGDGEPGTYVQVDPDRLIESVFIAPDSERWLQEVIEGIMETYGFPKLVVRSRLYESTPL